MSHTHAHRVLFLGHSFIWRLENFVQNCTLPCVDTDFALPPSTLLCFHGVGGRKLDTLRRRDLSAVAAFKPTIIVLDIGSNDLTDPNLTIDVSAANIMTLIYDLHFRFQVRHIILGQILPRLRSPITCPDYNMRVGQLNRALLSRIKRVSFATLWFHHRIANDYYLLFLHDGVHLNMAGNHLLHHSYREALTQCLQRLTRTATNRRHLMLSYRETWLSGRRAVRPRPY